jgi:uncharacterized protein YkwD
VRSFGSGVGLVLARLAALLLTAGLLSWAASGSAAGAVLGEAALDTQLGEAVVAAINEARVAQGRAPLRVSRQLRKAAGEHALSMATLGYFSHSSANGSSVTRRIASFYGAGGSKSWAVGEVLIWRAGNMSAQSAVSVWLGSAGHANQVLGRWRDVGVAAVRAANAPGVYGGRSVTIIVVDFGRR